MFAVPFLGTNIRTSAKSDSLELVKPSLFRFGKTLIQNEEYLGLELRRWQLFDV